MSRVRTPIDPAALRLVRDPHGRLVLTTPDGTRHEGVLPVRAFPIAAPDEGLALVGSDGHELAWVDRLADLAESARAIVEEELAQREFVPVIQRLLRVSTFSTPSTWQVLTDRGEATLQLRVEEDIRRIGHDGRLLITDSHGVSFAVPDRFALDARSRRLLERFL